MSDVPTEPLPGGYGGVVDLGEFRIRHGRTPHKDASRVCKHLRLTIVGSERRINCDDCGKDVEPFEVVQSLTRYWSDLDQKIQRDRAKAAEAMKATLVRRAAKALDRTWGHKMSPACPHCRGYILPEDFADGVASSFNSDMERARRARINPKEPTP